MQNLFYDLSILASQAKGIFTIEILTLLVLLVMLFRDPIVEMIFNIIFSVLGINKDIKKKKDTKTIKTYIFLSGLYLLGYIWIKDESLLGKFTLAYRIITIVTICRVLAEALSDDGLIIKVLDEKTEKDFRGTILTNKFISIMIEGVIYLVGTFIIITEFGYNINGLVAGLGVGSAVIAFALQDLVKSVISGASIISEKPFVTGDFIELGTTEGTVEDITLRNTVIRALDNTVVTIPNSIVISAAVKNWDKIQTRYITMKLMLPIEMDEIKIERVRSKVRHSLRNNPTVIPDTEMVSFNAITTRGLELFIYCYITEIKYVRYLREREKINIEILEILKAEGATPLYDVKEIRTDNIKANEEKLHIDIEE